MGWENKQPHAFYLKKQIYLPCMDKRGTCPKKSDVDGKSLPEEMFSLDDLIFQAGAKLKYHYDPEGDNWIHDISVESIRYLNPDWPYPIYCLEGIRACPPESCGGVDGFCALLKTLKDPTAPNEGQFERFGDFDPDRFSLEKVNKSFKVNGQVNSDCGSIISISRKKASQSKEIDPLARLGQTLRKKAVS